MRKVEICGIDTSQLGVLSEEKKRELIRRTQAGDAAAREELVMGNLRLVLSVIQRFRARSDDLDDLFQVGCIGLLKAIRNFDLNLGVRFSTYAVPMIIGEIRRSLRDDTPMRISRGMRDLAYRALQVRERLSTTQDHDPTTAEIAEKLGEKESEVAAALEAIVDPVSLYDAVYNDNDDTTYVIDQLGSEDVGDESFVESIALKEAMGKLSKRELHVILSRFYRGKTQMEIAAEIGISQAQVSRVEKGAIEKMRKYME